MDLESPDRPLYLAGSNETFGKTIELPQTATNGFAAPCAGGSRRVASLHLTREDPHASQLFRSGGILFNHESAQSRYQFATRKVASGVPAL